ncbi:MAG TPA: methyltransferase domain-containing protein [Stellaceae bacterium]|nr:methyltransferase domain-containing protein [Stellaceae bacterium]
MNSMSADERNADQIAYWNGVGGRHWVTRQQTQDIVLAPISAAIIARAAVRPGERLVDIGCGCGDTTIELGRRVGATGGVLGLDISGPMLARAAERLPPALPVKLVQADATTYPFAPGGFDLLFSRFGVMFFAEPARSFANLRRALRPDGRLAFACWRAPRENPWMMLPLHAAYEHVPPLPQLGPEDPGPFSFADAERVRRILDAAGFRSIAIEPLDLALDIACGGGLGAAVAGALEIGPTSRAIDGQPPEILAAVAASIRTALAAHQRGTAVPLAAAAWLVTAANP